MLIKNLIPISQATAKLKDKLKESWYKIKQTKDNISEW